MFYYRGKENDENGKAALFIWVGPVGSIRVKNIQLNTCHLIKGNRKLHELLDYGVNCIIFSKTVISILYWSMILKYFN